MGCLSPSTMTRSVGSRVISRAVRLSCEAKQCGGFLGKAVTLSRNGAQWPALTYRRNCIRFDVVIVSSSTQLYPLRRNVVKERNVVLFEVIVFSST